MTFVILVNIVSGNGLMSDWHQAIIWSNADFYETNLSEINSKINNLPSKALAIYFVSSMCWKYVKVIHCYMGFHAWHSPLSGGIWVQYFEQIQQSSSWKLCKLKL